MGFVISEDYKSIVLDVDYFDNKRFYRSPTSNLWLGSVTSVVGYATRNDMNWWKAKASKEELEAAERQKILSGLRGTELHTHLENYLTDYIIPDDYGYEHLPLMFSAIKKELDKHMGKIYGMEQQLYSDELQIAGRYDLIAEWDGELAVIDFKNSTKLKKLQWIQNYLIQEATYAYMFYERFDVLIKKLVTLIAVENMEDAQVFDVPLKKAYIQKIMAYSAEFGQKYYWVNS